MFETIWARTDTRCKNILEPTLELAIEIAREGRKGHRIGTIFTVGDAVAVLARSHSLILIHSPNTRKNYATLRM
jgi:DNA integrity scanning protein DisA with diadenylate cyclase activity